jgi:hypothetical protein
MKQMNLWPWDWQKTETEVHRQYLADLDARENGREPESIKEKEMGVVEHVS